MTLLGIHSTTPSSADVTEATDVAVRRRARGGLLRRLAAGLRDRRPLATVSEQVLSEIRDVHSVDR